MKSLSKYNTVGVLISSYVILSKNDAAETHLAPNTKREIPVVSCNTAGEIQRVSHILYRTSLHLTPFSVTAGHTTQQYTDHLIREYKIRKESGSDVCVVNLPSTVGHQEAGQDVLRLR